MTYSCTDFADSIQNKLQEVGALHAADKLVEGYNDDPGAQATACLNAIDRLLEVRDAAIAQRDALLAWGSRDVLAPTDPTLLPAIHRAEARLQAALDAVAKPAQ
jgi:hypothetical protein